MKEWKEGVEKNGEADEVMEKGNEKRRVHGRGRDVEKGGEEEEKV